MSRFDEVRVVYTDDHQRRDLVGRSLTRHDLSEEQQRATFDAEIAEEEAEAEPHKGYRPGDPAQLRGLPVVGVYGGLGGAIRGTKPHLDGIR